MHSKNPKVIQKRRGVKLAKEIERRMNVVQKLKDSPYLVGHHTRLYKMYDWTIISLLKVHNTHFSYNLVKTTLEECAKKKMMAPRS